MENQYTVPKDWTDLINDYKKGLPIIELVMKYKITPARIYQILDKHNVPRNNPNPKKQEEISSPATT